MRKISIFGIMMLIVILALTSCVSLPPNSTTTKPSTTDEPVHIHTESNSAAIEATCTRSGLTEGTYCSECGEVLMGQEIIPLLPHTESDWILGREATMFEEGYMYIECIVCHTVLQTEKIEKLPCVVSEGLEFELNEDGQSYSVVGRGTCTDRNIVIPDIYKNLPVTEVGNNAFERDYLITGVVLGNCIDVVGKLSFSYCSYLENVVISNSVDIIEFRAFENCDSLVQLTLGNSVKEIKQSAFENCDSLSTLIIPDSVINIGDYSFENCYKLSQVKFGNSVTSIGMWAFAGCNSLTNITIPSSVTYVGSCAFYYCDSLVELCNKSSIKTEEMVNNTESARLTPHIGYCVKHIINNESESFVKYVDDAVFYDDGTDVYLVKYFSKEKDIVLPTYENGTKYEIYQNAFRGNSNIETVVIPEFVTGIGEYAFYGCSNLTDISISNSVTSIGSKAFGWCDSLSSIRIPSSITTIGEDALAGCRCLINIDVAEDNKYYASIDGNLYANVGKTLIQYATGKNESSFTLPDGVTSIEGHPFTLCSSLTVLNVPNSLVKIEYGVLDALSSLQYNEYDNAYYLGNEENPYVALIKVKDTSVTSCEIHIGTRFIYGYAFSGCSSLETLNIPNSVVGIGASAFSNCNLITSIKIPSSVIYVSDCAFDNAAFTYIDVDKENQYYKSIDGNLYTKDGTTLIRYAIGKTDTHFDIPIGVIYIGNYAFNRCISLISVDIPDSVTAIGNSAFNSCYYLNRITGGSSLESIGDYAIAYCDRLSYIELGDDLVSIGRCAFYYCGLSEIVIPKSVQHIQIDAFENCYKLWIYFEHESQPIGWWNDWNPDNRPVTWGYVSK